MYRYLYSLFSSTLYTCIYIYTYIYIYMYIYIYICVYIYTYIYISNPNMKHPDVEVSHFIFP